MWTPSTWTHLTHCTYSGYGYKQESSSVSTPRELPCVLHTSPVATNVLAIRNRTRHPPSLLRLDRALIHALEPPALHLDRLVIFCPIFIASLRCSSSLSLTSTTLSSLSNFKLLRISSRVLLLSVMTQFSSHFPVTGSELLSYIVHASTYVLDVAITPVTHRMDSFSALYTWIELRNGTRHSFHLSIRVQRRPLESGLDGCHRPSTRAARTTLFQGRSWLHPLQIFPAPPSKRIKYDDSVSQERDPVSTSTASAALSLIMMPQAST